jgi:hypothetical protein
MKNLAKAVIAVMKEVKGIDKTMTVGNGNSSYKGVPDQEVKKILGESMERNGLCVLPIDVQPTTTIERWVESGQYGDKQKQQVFTEVKTKYLLLHESGESIELAGYGHGVDSQDKGAGKATTYALKYAMLYTFFVPTGKIDDADTIHSDKYEMPQKLQLKTEVKSEPKTALTPCDMATFDKMTKSAKEATTPEKKQAVLNKATNNYSLSSDQLALLKSLCQ